MINKELFSINNSVLTFTIKNQIGKPSLGKDIKFHAESSCNITNLTGNYLAFRTKTTRKEEYAVQPTHAIIPPHGTITIVFNKSTANTDTSGHKFKFDALMISPEDKGKDAKTIFAKASKDAEIFSIKRNVELIISNEKEIENSQMMMSMSEIGNSNISGQSGTTEQPINAPNAEQPQKEHLELLKVEFYKLKNQLITLTEKYNNLKNRVDMEKRSGTSVNKKTSK